MRLGKVGDVGEHQALGLEVPDLPEPGEVVRAVGGSPTAPERRVKDAELRVYVDVDAQVDLVLSPTATEEVTDVGQAEAVDLKKTEVNFNYTADATQNLPLGRSYSGLFQLIPGIAQNNGSIGPSAGGSRQDNTYLMDGVNITNPGFGYLETEINELDIAEST